MITLADLDNEGWLAQRMRDHRGPDVFDGVTDKAVRCSRFRAAIKTNALTSVVIGSREGKPWSWADAFKRVYGEEL